MPLIAVAVFVIAYVLIATERVNKVLAALGGAAVLLAVGVTDSEHAFYSNETGIDWDIIFLLFAMMVIVGILRRTGIFEYLAIWAVRRGKGSPLRIMVVLTLITALASAFLDNVTTVLLIVPVTLLVCDRLGISPVPYLIAEVMASNLGGAATLIGDPPNLVIAGRSGLTFNDFLVHMTPLVVIELAVFVLILPWLFKGSFTVDPARIEDVLRLDPRAAIGDRPLLVKCGVVLLAVLAGFVGRPFLGLEPSVVALLGAGILVLISGVDTRDYLSGVEWQTLLFFAGLFILVGGLVRTGVIGRLAGRVADVTEDRALLAVMLILVVSAVLSGFIDNIPYVAAMSPVVLELTRAIPDPAQAQALWWALAIGSDFGGNATAVGASANVVVIGLALRAGSPITFWEFTRKGLVVVAITIAVAAPYLWLRYFVLA